MESRCYGRDLVTTKVELLPNTALSSLFCCQVVPPLYCDTARQPSPEAAPRSWTVQPPAPTMSRVHSAMGTVGLKHMIEMLW
jgi:hypothetical protein